jgi:hypothetical protein
MKKLLVLIALLSVIYAATTGTASAHPGKPWVSPKLAQNYVLSKYDIISVKCFGMGQGERHNGALWYAHVSCVSRDDRNNVYCFVFHPTSKTTFKVVYFRCGQSASA